MGRPDFRHRVDRDLPVDVPRIVGAQT